MAGVMLTDWSLQYFGIKESTNSRRFVTGLIGGFGLNTLKLKSYNGIVKDNEKIEIINEKCKKIT